MESLTGNLLVASSLATDPILTRGVCLLVHDDQDSVIGVMLNRPMHPNPQALMAMLGEPLESQDTDVDSPEQEMREGESKNRLPEISKGQSSSELPSPPTPYSPVGMVHFGGPLSGPVVAIHQLSEYAEAETGNGIYVAAQKQHLEGLVNKQPGPYRLIIGHLGWETERLNAELEAGLWHIVPATADVVFENADEMWPRLIRRATSRSVARWIGISDIPKNPELN
ncbi:YqgE/AlgH family protein [Novipirellula sp. SH528]|uniref:YqgE/AlgH family protein n=1 Tax=Novipirellula sp. SH528 TaxID=3454466 RepID=UPI003F9F2B9F